MQRLNYDGLTKIPNQPAARLLAAAGAKLSCKLKAPASASVAEVMRELAGREELFDMLKLLSVALPAREAVWWSCLAARDLLEPGQMTPSLAAAEAWVFKPDAANRAAAQRAMEGADIDDDTVYCALAATYADGRMGEGDLAGHAAPPGAVSTAAMTMNVNAFLAHQDRADTHGPWLVARALDIARGGNGQIPAPPPPAAAEVEGEDDEDRAEAAEAAPAGDEEVR